MSHSRRTLLAALGLAQVSPKDLAHAAPKDIANEKIRQEELEFERRETEVIEGRVYAPTLAEVMDKVRAQRSQQG